MEPGLTSISRSFEKTLEGDLWCAGFSLNSIPSPKVTHDCHCYLLFVLQQRSKGILLGVVGTDVPVKELLKTIPKYKVMRHLTVKGQVSKILSQPLSQPDTVIMKTGIKEAPLLSFWQELLFFFFLKNSNSSGRSE